MLTTIARGLHEQTGKKVWIKSDHPDLFKNNPDVGLILPFNALLSRFALALRSIKLVRPSYAGYDEVLDKDSVPEKHIVLKLADCVGLKGEIKNKPELVLTEAEVRAGVYAKDQLVIITSSVNGKIPMHNKEWLAERYQQLADRLSDQYTILQLGAADDYPLNNVTDLRGKTNLRESAAVLHNSRLLIAHVGFLMHLARAVDCPAVIIYGGREMPEQSGYAAYHNIYSAVECSPCWLRNLCHYDRKCMTAISVDSVYTAVEQQLQRPVGPLPVDSLFND